MAMTDDKDFKIYVIEPPKDGGLIKMHTTVDVLRLYDVMSSKIEEVFGSAAFRPSDHLDREDILATATLISLFEKIKRYGERKRPAPEKDATEFKEQIASAWIVPFMQKGREEGRAEIVANLSKGRSGLLQIPDSPEQQVHAGFGGPQGGQDPGEYTVMDTEDTTLRIDLSDLRAVDGSHRFVDDPTPRNRAERRRQRHKPH
jgi:hypothetical protein